MSSKALSLREILRIKGAPYILITFFAYSAMESTTGLWASSYLVQYLLMEPEKAAKFASFFYLGITVGRFLCGFVADRMGDKALIRLGGGIAGAGILLVLIPFPVTTPALLGLVIIGFGCAPVYPAIIHSTPFYFGKENSQALIGIQMACAYVGSTFMPPLFGTLAARIGIWLYPVFLLVLGADGVDLRKIKPDPKWIRYGADRIEIIFGKGLHIKNAAAFLQLPGAAVLTGSSAV